MNTEREVYADSEAALNKLRRNGIQIDTGAKLVCVSDRRPLGIKLWGAVDYRKRFAGYGWGKVR